MDWLPPTSCRTFDEIQTFGPIPLAGCGYRGPRNGIVYSATTVDPPWIPEDECPKREIGKLDNWRARWSDKRPRVLHAKQIGPRWSIEHYRISRSRQFTTNATKFIFMIPRSGISNKKKILIAEVMSDQHGHISITWCAFYSRRLFLYLKYHEYERSWTRDIYEIMKWNFPNISDIPKSKIKIKLSLKNSQISNVKYFPSFL